MVGVVRVVNVRVIIVGVAVVMLGEKVRVVVGSAEQKASNTRSSKMR